MGPSWHPSAVARAAPAVPGLDVLYHISGSSQVYAGLTAGDGRNHSVPDNPGARRRHTSPCQAPASLATSACGVAIPPGPGLSRDHGVGAPKATPATTKGQSPPI
ncbi:hypothetical protein NDU88_008276 [Pleurodeles waltl]|uniref:Uncharacterized protein n=1 Tax=Pleurodeles waltl TaxID=8319 RepID=A0AAV7VS33_PLEWA|nr:hypothetical protein NDU88_008276 [Pleurodeles waltl]